MKLIRNPYCLSPVPDKLLNNYLTDPFFFNFDKFYMAPSASWLSEPFLGIGEKALNIFKKFKSFDEIFLRTTFLPLYRSCRLEEKLSFCFAFNNHTLIFLRDPIHKHKFTLSILYEMKA